MQRIEIHNFGPIKDVALDIKDYTVFIGPNASGKSTIAKAVYFFKSLAEELKSCFLKLQQTGSFHSGSKLFQKTIKKKCDSYWNRTYWNSGSIIKFSFDKDDVITIKHDGGQFSSPKVELNDSIREKFERHLKPFGEIGKKIVKNDETSNVFEMFLFQQKLNSFFPGNHDYSYIPAGRTVFSAVRNELNPKTDVFTQDYLVGEFVVAINQIRKFFSDNTVAERIKEEIADFKDYEHHVTNGDNEAQGLTKKVNNIHLLAQKILSGDYHYNKNKDQIIIAKDKCIPVVDSSSGQQESLWILLFLIHTLSTRFFNNFTIIEEPEAHLFPESQKNMMWALTYFANVPNNQLMLTTHSPYILTPLNNLLYAHTLGQDESKREAVAKIIDPDLWLDPNRFDCYYVDKGEITSVVDRDVNMINLEQLDSASTIGNEEYDKLSELES